MASFYYSDSSSDDDSYEEIDQYAHSSARGSSSKFIFGKTPAARAAATERVVESVAVPSPLKRFTAAAEVAAAQSSAPQQVAAAVPERDAASADDVDSVIGSRVEAVIIPAAAAAAADAAAHKVDQQLATASELQELRKTIDLLQKEKQEMQEMHERKIAEKEELHEGMVLLLTTQKNSLIRDINENAKEKAQHEKEVIHLRDALNQAEAVNKALSEEMLNLMDSLKKKDEDITRLTKLMMDKEEEEEKIEETVLQQQQNEEQPDMVEELMALTGTVMIPGIPIFVLFFVLYAFIWTIFH